MLFGNSNCYSFGNTSVSSWTWYFGSKLHNVDHITFVVPTLEFAQMSVNITVLVIYGDQTDDGVLCKTSVSGTTYKAVCDDYAYGYAVKISVSLPKASLLNVCDVQIFAHNEGSPVNLATKGVTRQSSRVNDNKNSHNAVDGTVSCSSTANELNPSWRLFFDSKLYDIHRVYVHIPDIEFDTLEANITVHVRSGNDVFLCKHDGVPTPPVFKANCHGDVYGNSIRIITHFNKPASLKICNVVVHGRYRGAAGVLTGGYSTSQTSTLVPDDQVSYDSQNAVDGTDSCSGTDYDLKSTWKISFEKVYEINSVEFNLSSQATKTIKANVFVYVLSDSNKKHLCQPVTAVTAPLFRTDCTYTHGHSVEISAVLSEPASLKICGVLVYGRPVGSQCDNPRIVVGKRYVYNSTNFNSVVTEQCDDNAGYYYTGGSQTGVCSSSDSKWHNLTSVCQKKKNIARGKPVLLDGVVDVSEIVDDNDNTCTLLNQGGSHSILVNLEDVYEIHTVTISLLKTASLDIPVSAYAKKNASSNLLKPCDRDENSAFTNTASFNCDTRPYAGYVLVYVEGGVDICEVRVLGERRDGNKTFQCADFTRGRKFKGDINFTVTGESCYPWDQVKSSEFTDITYFPEYSLRDVGNKCRNPIDSGWIPWCYTSKQGKWGYCPVFTCNTLCNSVKSPYKGKMDKTKSGLQCQQWSEDFPHKHSFKLNSLFPDETSAQAYCRNPLTSQSTPWCFTTDKTVTYEACDIPSCPTQFDSQIYNTSNWEYLKHQDQCFYLNGIFRTESVDMKNPISVCSVENKGILICYKKLTDTVEWKFFLIDCEKKTSVASTTTTPPSTVTTASFTDGTTISSSTLKENSSTAVSSMATVNITSSFNATVTATTSDVTTINSTSSAITKLNDTTSMATINTTSSSMTAINATTSTITTLSATTLSATSSIKATSPSTITSTTTPPQHCPCVCRVVFTSEQLSLLKTKAETESRHLIVEKKTLSKFRRQLYSAPDERPVSVGIGTSSILIMCFLTSIIVFSDIISFFTWIVHICRHSS